MPRGRHGMPQRCLPWQAPRPPILYLMGTVPQEKAQPGAPPELRLPESDGPLLCDPEREGCVLRDRRQGQRAPSCTQSAGAAHRRRAPGACEHTHDADHTPSSPRLSKTHPGQGLGEVGSLPRRGLAPKRTRRARHSPSRHSPGVVAVSLKVESKNGSCAEGTFKPSNVTKVNGGVRVAAGTPTHSHTHTHTWTHTLLYTHSCRCTFLHTQTCSQTHTHTLM